MAGEIKATDLSLLPAESLDSSYQINPFTQAGDMDRVSFFDAVEKAVSEIAIYEPYKTTSNISAAGSGTTLQIPTTYGGDISNVSVWNGDILLRPTIVKGNDGTYDTVQIITGKAYTGARITVTFE